MAVFKCKMCGGTLEVNNETVAVCEFCGTKQTLPKLDDDRKANLFDRANHFRRNNEFDKAMGIYEQILNEDNTDAETYWSLVLCRYGIEYVEDPASRKRIPTVNRAQFTSIFDDEDYKSALRYADGYQKGIYEQEAATINDIQKGILEISNSEEPFDVFICYKETDNNGQRTPDSVLANDLYHQLTSEGFKVFYAAITLEDKIGSAYEPYIFAALNSAKVMVVLGTKPEFFNAVWVKNEWSRYLALIKQGQKKMLIPAYKDMDPYDLPEEFSHPQAQDMSKLGFMQDLIRGIKKIVNQSEKVAPSANPVVQTDINTIIKRAFLTLEDKDWEFAGEQAEKLLDINPECAEAYLIRLLIDLKLPTKEDLKSSTIIFNNNSNYIKAVRFANNELKTLLVESCECVTETQQKIIYDKAKELLYTYKIENVEKAKAMYESIADYEDSKRYIFRCNDCIKEIKEIDAKIKIWRKVLKFAAIIVPFVIVVIIAFFIFVPPFLKYNSAIKAYNNEEYHTAYEYFSSSTYRDSEEMALKCQYGYVKQNYDRTNETTYEYLKELKIENYKDSVELFEELYAWNIALVSCNTNKNDYSTKLSSIPEETDFLHMKFVITGGEPGKKITMYHKTQWPGKNASTSSWYWEDQYSGSTFGCEWPNGTTSSAGIFTIEFYNAKDDSYIDSISIPVSD